MKCVLWKQLQAIHLLIKATYVVNEVYSFSSIIVIRHYKKGLFNFKALFDILLFIKKCLYWESKIHEIMSESSYLR